MKKYKTYKTYKTDPKGVMHYCYSCKRFFEYSDPKIKSYGFHLGCKSKKNLGVCINSKQFKPILLKRHRKEDLTEAYGGLLNIINSIRKKMIRDKEYDNGYPYYSYFFVQDMLDHEFLEQILVENNFKNDE